MADFTSHEHGVCSFLSSHLFRWTETILLLCILPEWAVELFLITLAYMMKEFCPHKE